MPEFNLIQRPDLILRLQQMLGIRQAHVTPTLAETVTPVVLIGDIRDEATAPQASVTARYAVCLTVIAGGVGAFSQMQIRSPVGSPDLLTIEKIRVLGGGAAVGAFEATRQDGTADFVTLTMQANLTNPTQDTPLLPSLPRPSAILSSRSTGVGTFGTGSGAYGVIMKHIADSDAEYEFPGTGFVIPPGTSFLAGNLTANQACTFTVSFREERIARG
ncbi:MAG TPA: hypothetical protein VGQ06_14040 [Gemmatimonadales bacterium]|jgi:hypothetical protein|nr:hypothetical protein [Gemmatimonadales bacterium]